MDDVSSYNEDEHFKFLDLPKEIRLMIYERLPWKFRYYDLECGTGVYDPEGEHRMISVEYVIETAILRTCHLVHEEAQLILRRLTDASDTTPHIVMKEGPCLFAEIIDSVAGLTSNSPSEIIKWRTSEHERHNWRCEGLDQLFVKRAVELVTREPTFKVGVQVNPHTNPAEFCSFVLMDLIGSLDWDIRHNPMRAFLVTLEVHGLDTSSCKMELDAARAYGEIIGVTIAGVEVTPDVDWEAHWGPCLVDALDRLGWKKWQKYQKTWGTGARRAVYKRNAYARRLLALYGDSC